MAKLYFKYGVMGSSKTAQALMCRFNYMEKGYEVLLLKSAVDTRDKEDEEIVVKSRIGLSARCQTITRNDNLYDYIKSQNFFRPNCVVIVDEVQFLSATQIEQLKAVSVYVPVLCYGLLTNFKTQLFEGSKRLVEIADSLHELKSVCRCGKKANVNARFVDGKIVIDGDEILIGGNESYEALCYCCYEKLKRASDLHNKPKIVLASNNKHKIKEFGEILSDYQIVPMSEIGFCEEIVEDGATFVENSRIKARAVVKYMKENGIKASVLADDSGLCVNALGGAPGIYSARYAGDHGDNEANRQKLLSELKGVDDRSAYFNCTLVFLDEDGNEFCVDGKTYGRITNEYRGDTSFCYDCLFFSDDLGKTFGEATDNEKNSVSHRSRAIAQLKKLLSK